MIPFPELIFVIGARPNFMKVAPLLTQLAEQRAPFQPRVVHTGQHYDVDMSDIFLQELGIKEIDAFLGVGSGSHGRQTAKVLDAFEQYLLARPNPPAGVVVVGDVNSTLACALASAKLQIPVAHVEAGLRSDDRAMPEEINRTITDSLSDVLFVSEPSGLKRLRKEGIPYRKIFYVGNVMIDSLIRLLPQAFEQRMPERLNLQARHYGLVTLHRPENVDCKDRLQEILNFLEKVAACVKLVFPVHPRTGTRLTEFGLLPNLQRHPNIQLMKPLGYLQNLNLMAESQFVLTDSGGIQEETTYLQVPCLTLRKNTERPVTISRGTNILVGHDLAYAMECVELILMEKFKRSFPIEGWDGQAAGRIVSALTGAWSGGKILHLPQMPQTVSE